MIGVCDWRLEQTKNFDGFFWDEDKNLRLRFLATGIIKVAKIVWLLFLIGLYRSK